MVNIAEVVESMPCRSWIGIRFLSMFIASMRWVKAGVTSWVRFALADMIYLESEGRQKTKGALIPGSSLDPTTSTLI